jgi:hypothetical protein
VSSHRVGLNFVVDISRRIRSSLVYGRGAEDGACGRMDGWLVGQVCGGKGNIPTSSVVSCS